MGAKPNLFIIGAMKSGTSSLHNYLAAHPQIFMSAHKEPMHFSRSENWSRGHDTYLELFADVRDECYIGESSTEYAKLPFFNGVAERLHAFNPDARIVYLMRDPFERVVSQYKHMVNTGRESRPLSESINRHWSYLCNSHYAYQLTPYLELFGREAVYVDTFEALTASPGDLCRRVFRWLGVDEDYAPDNLTDAYNVSPAQVMSIDNSTLVGRTASRLKRSSVLRTLIPPALRQKAMGFVPQKQDMDFTTEAFKADVAKVRAQVTPILRNWIDELEELIGGSYEQWPCYNESREIGPAAARLLETMNDSLRAQFGEQWPYTAGAGQRAVYP